MDWLRDHGWAGWLVLSLVLAGAEMLTLDLTLLMLAAGALAAAGVAVVAPTAWLLQVVVGVVVALLMLFLLRPTLLEKMRRSPGYRNSIKTLVGSSALVVEEISAGGGEVKVNGDNWNARSFDPQLRILAGQQVEIYEVEGTTLVVYPAEGGIGQAKPYGELGV